MRKTIGLLGCLVLLAGCGSDNSSTTGSGSTSRLAGTWATQSLVPGSRTDMTLTVANNQVTGTGDYRIEAGRSGTFTVTGTISDPNFNLTLKYDYGIQEVYKGSVADTNHLTGTVQLSGFPDSTLALVRQ